MRSRSGSSLLLAARSGAANAALVRARSTCRTFGVKHAAQERCGAPPRVLVAAPAAAAAALLLGAVQGNPRGITPAGA